MLRMDISLSPMTTPEFDIVIDAQTVKCYATLTSN